jgi:hypothetical protein
LYWNILTNWILCTGMYSDRLVIFTGIFLLAEYLYWNILTGWIFCTGIFLLAEYFVLEYPYWLNILYWNILTDWIFCTGMYSYRLIIFTGIFLLAEHFVLEHVTDYFTGIFLLTEYFVLEHLTDYFYWNILTDWIFCYWSVPSDYWLPTLQITHDSVVEPWPQVELPDVQKGHQLLHLCRNIPAQNIQSVPIFQHKIFSQ